MLQVSRATGIMVDPVYSGKALCGMLDLMKNSPGTFKGRRLMFVHTGGVYGMYDKVSGLWLAA